MTEPVGTVDADCWVCGIPLPPIGYTVTATYGERVEVELTPDISRAYMLRARMAHPFCFGGREDAPVEVAA